MLADSPCPIDQQRGLAHSGRAVNSKGRWSWLGWEDVVERLEVRLATDEWIRCRRKLPGGEPRRCVGNGRVGRRWTTAVSYAVLDATGAVVGATHPATVRDQRHPHRPRSLAHPRKPCIPRRRQRQRQASDWI